MKYYELLKYCLDKASVSTNPYEEYIYLGIINTVLQETLIIVAEEKSLEKIKREKNA